jgi:hypothetical protein
MHIISDNCKYILERKKERKYIYWTAHTSKIDTEVTEKNRSKYIQVKHNGTRKVQPKWSLSQPMLLRHSMNVARALFL